MAGASGYVLKQIKSIDLVDSVRKVGRGERLNCRQPGLSVTSAQVLEGRGLRILAAKARNRGKQPVVLEEH